MIDSGGQYFGGTTDITRTIALGKVMSEAIEDFTLVLKGHIALDSAIYPEGTQGHQLDLLARQALWNNYKNYGHGTGHGVGFFLNVHEGPQSIRPVGSTDRSSALAHGMLTSNEPGMYIEGKYGIRIENLVLTVKDKLSEYGQFLKFETVTLAHIDLNLIDKSQLTPDEINWLNKYHKKVYDLVSPRLNTEEAEWLKEKTKSI